MRILRTFQAAVCVIASFLVGTTGAQATSKGNMELIGKHFESLGAVRFQAFAPLGGPEIGVAEIKPGAAKSAPPKGAFKEAALDQVETVPSGNHKLIAVRIADKGRIETLLSEPFSSAGNGEDFAFMASGRHLITYAASEWTD